MLNIKEVRKKNRYTRKAVADYVGVTEQAIYTWEAGIAVPDAIKLKKVAEFFGCEMEDLFKDKEA